MCQYRAIAELNRFNFKEYKPKFVWTPKLTKFQQLDSINLVRHQETKSFC